MGNNQNLRNKSRIIKKNVKNRSNFKSSNTQVFSATEAN